jgi:hypothetical protein
MEGWRAGYLGYLIRAVLIASKQFALHPVTNIRGRGRTPMSAFGGKADMTFCENPHSRSLSGAKRTRLFASLHMSANDP